jgi:hypothetical protein
MIRPKRQRYADVQHRHEPIAHQRTQPATHERNHRPRPSDRWFFADAANRIPHTERHTDFLPTQAIKEPCPPGEYNFLGSVVCAADEPLPDAVHSVAQQALGRLHASVRPVSNNARSLHPGSVLGRRRAIAPDESVLHPRWRGSL